MAEPINLNRTRKVRAKAAAKVAAAENRVRHGRTGAEKTATRLESDRLARTVEGARRERD